MAEYNVWRFVPGDHRLSHSDGRRLVPPCRHTVAGPPELCLHGFHGSLTLREALSTGYPNIANPLLTSSRIGGDVAVGYDKLCGTVLHTDWIATREETGKFLRLWAVWLGRSVLHLARDKDRDALTDALRVAELYAWGAATNDDLLAAGGEATRAAEWGSGAAYYAAQATVFATSERPARGAELATESAIISPPAPPLASWSAMLAARDAAEIAANDLFIDLFGGEYAR